ncbi:response regulator [Algoriphagus halophytocola]|uniref:response regulator n=1 Tax=Algoriphagus halophytocola TaxID=2991499 RepID=UPI00387327EE
MNYATASNGICGLDLLTDQDEKPHYIFLDLNMPMLSGKECLSKIRKLQGYKDVPIIIFSTSSFRGDIEDCKKLGASHFFTKVTSISQLSETITKLVSGVEMPYVLN